jgi:hypothetical protein
MATPTRNNGEWWMRRQSRFGLLAPPPRSCVILFTRRPILPAVRSVARFALARIQNPSLFGERDIDALLPESDAEFDRQLVEHRLDLDVRQVAEIGVHGLAGEESDGFAVRSYRAIRPRPSISEPRRA